MTDIKNILAAAQRLIDNKLVSNAQDLLNSNGLKHLKIIDGKIVDESDECEIWLNKFITVNKQMLDLKDDVRKLAKVNNGVLITGPTGTGKELLARALQGKRTGRFMALNCAGLPENLVESELFGHMQGAFTGASTTKDGLMSLAEDGTLFLDEVGELPMQVQAKLLRATSGTRRTIRKVGGKNDEEINCRIVCATNKELSELCKEHKFRIDLYARLSTFELRTTSLVDRKEDIEKIILSMPGGKELLDAWAKDGLEHSCAIPNVYMPFNVRSLEQIVDRYKVLGKLPI